MSGTRLGLALLAAQLGLIAITWWPSDPEALRRRPLIEFGREAITEIEVASRPEGGTEEAAARSVHLVREGDGWNVASAAGYPADATKVDELLDLVTGLEVQAPIATQATSFDVLDVGEDSYGRRVRVVAGDEERSVVLGAATSNSVNLRLEGEDEVYVAKGASEWSFRETSSSYYDSLYLEAPVDDLATVTVANEQGTIVFIRASDGTGWVVQGLAEGESADSEKIASFLREATRVRLAKPVGRLDPAAGPAGGEYALDSGPRVDWTIAAADQSLVGGYRVGAEHDGSTYVKAQSSPFVVDVTSSALDRLRQAAREDFVTAPVDAPEP